MSDFIDTNILLYAALRSGSDSEKRRRAREILAEGDCILSVQVLNEFIVQATRASRPNRLSPELAIEHVTNWRRFPVQELTLNLFESAVGIFRRHKFSFWDSMIIAAAVAQGCDTLYSEDMQHGRIIDGTKIVDPFR